MVSINMKCSTLTEIRAAIAPEMMMYRLQKVTYKADKSSAIFNALFSSIKSRLGSSLFPFARELVSPSNLGEMGNGGMAEPVPIFIVHSYRKPVRR